MHYRLMTPRQAGAVAIIQCVGQQVAALGCKLSGRERLDIGRVYLAGLAGIDEGLVVLLREDVLQIMPHGGPRVVQKLDTWLREEGGQSVNTGRLRESDNALSDQLSKLYPEASCELEARALHAVAKAASPAAVPLLLLQKQAWSRWLKKHAHKTTRQEACESILRQSDQLQHLLMPPSVVVAGPANVGKSTLLNLLTGKATSIVADLPGTTRDWVGSLIELDGHSVGLAGAVAVQWVDTPGLRASADAVEQAAVGLARDQIAGADVLIAMTDAAHAEDWPELGCEPDLYVVNKCEQLLSRKAGQHQSGGVTQSRSKQQEALGSRDQPIQISALNDLGMPLLCQLVLERLGFIGTHVETMRSGQLPWAFDQVIRDALLRGELGAVQAMLDS